MQDFKGSEPRERRQMCVLTPCLTNTETQAREEFKSNIHSSCLFSINTSGKYLETSVSCSWINHSRGHDTRATSRMLTEFNLEDLGYNLVFSFLLNEKWETHFCECVCEHVTIVPDQWEGNFSALPSHPPSLPLVATVTGGNDTFGWADVLFLLISQHDRLYFYSVQVDVWMPNKNKVTMVTRWWARRLMRMKKKKKKLNTHTHVSSGPTPTIFSSSVTQLLNVYLWLQLLTAAALIT